jgi:hypothetical protein
MADTIAAPAARETAPAIASAAKSYSPPSALNFTGTTALDRAITADPRRSHHYRIVEVIPYGTEAPHRPGHLRHLQHQPGT